MSSLSQNPLAKHFRQPQIYLKLPSEGRWWAEGSLDLPITGELPVYAMTAKDEITMKTPDALMNGTSTVNVVQSCCPNIKDAWKMPAIDLDPILIAIRIATYGNEMEFTSICPHCTNKNESAIDLTVLLDKVKPIDYSKTVKNEDFEIILKPQNFEEFNKNNRLAFEEQRIIKLVQSESLDDDEKLTKFNELFQQLIDTGIGQVSKSIAGIKMSDGTVVDNPEFIREFLDNCEREIWDGLKETLDGIRAQSKFNEITITCDNTDCKKEYITPFAFEQTNFFA
jgi:hypothetical protein